MTHPSQSHREPAMNRDKLLALAKRHGFIDEHGEPTLFLKSENLLSALAALLSQQEQEPPSGYAYRYPDAGSSVIRFNDGQEVNGCRPIEAIPYWFAPPPAQGWNEATTSDETILSHMSKYWEHQWHDGDQHQIRIGREQLVAGIRALARPSQAQEQKCPACKGNDADMPCAYPGEDAAGCLRDQRIAASGAGDARAKSVAEQIMRIVNGSWIPGGAPQIQAEISRLIATEFPEPAQVTDDLPPLDQSEQYRMQMAAISTAAFGYWKIGDDIKPECVTVALKDVAKLYEKYENALSRAQHAAPERGESSCKEVDGCPTEKVVLQRFWREQHEARAQHAAPGALRNMVSSLTRYGMKTYQNNGYDWNAERVPSADGEFVMFEDVADAVEAMLEDHTPTAAAQPQGGGK